ncbi:MAG: hypothetical protein Q8J80_04485 [Gallionella sp.]|nr:hypothetical protein [Gallionella sp.]
MKVELEHRYRRTILEALRTCKSQGLDYCATKYLEELLQPKGVAINASEGDEVIYNGERYEILLRFNKGLDEGPDDNVLIVPYNLCEIEDLPDMHDLPLVPVTELSWPSLIN